MSLNSISKKKKKKNNNNSLLVPYIKRRLIIGVNPNKKKRGGCEGGV